MRQTGYKVRETFAELKLKTPVLLCAKALKREGGVRKAEGHPIGGSQTLL